MADTPKRTWSWAVFRWACVFILFIAVQAGSSVFLETTSGPKDTLNGPVATGELEQFLQFAQQGMEISDQQLKIRREPSYETEQDESHSPFPEPLLYIDEVSMGMRGENVLRVTFQLNVDSPQGGNRPVSGAMYFSGISRNGTIYTLIPRNTASTKFSISRIKYVMQDFLLPEQAPEGLIITLKESDGERVLLREQVSLQPNGR